MCTDSVLDYILTIKKPEVVVMQKEKKKTWYKFSTMQCYKAKSDIDQSNMSKFKRRLTLLRE